MAGYSSRVVARVGLDDRGFQEGVSRIQRSLKVVQSDFAAASSKLGDFGKSTDGLRLKADTLNKQIQLQNDKVAALTRSYEESVRTKGEDATVIYGRTMLAPTQEEVTEMQMNQLDLLHMLTVVEQY